MQTFKKTLFAVALAAFGGASIAAPAMSAEDAESYSMGASVANYLSAQMIKQQELGLASTKALVLKGFTEAFEGKSALSTEDILKALQAREEKLNALEEKAMNAAREKNAADGAAYLAKNAKKAGVVTTASGLQYEVIEAGKGAKPGEADVVTVNYEGRLLDGTVFDTTKGRMPARLVVMSVVPGFEEGLLLMNEGGKYRFTIPAKLAYGRDGVAQIPPEATLVFEVELVKVEKVKGHEGMGMMGGMGRMANPHQ